MHVAAVAIGGFGQPLLPSLHERSEHFLAPHIRLGTVCSAFVNARSAFSQNRVETLIDTI